MGFFSKLFNKNNFPIKKLEDTYQSFFNRYSPEIIDFMESKGYAYRDVSGIHIDFNYISRATNILAEYALFLKACVIYYVKRNMDSCPEIELRNAFPLANELVKKASSIAEYRSAVLNRLDDYFNSIEGNIIYGYSTQNYFGPQNYEFIENVCDMDIMRFALMFTDCYYYIVVNEKHATTNEIKSVKELAKNDSYQESNYYLKIAERLKNQAEILGEEVIKVLVNR